MDFFASAIKWDSNDTSNWEKEFDTNIYLFFIQYDHNKKIILKTQNQIIIQQSFILYIWWEQ